MKLTISYIISLEFTYNISTRQMLVAHFLNLINDKMCCYWSSNYKYQV